MKTIIKDKIMKFAEIREKQRIAITPLAFLDWSGLIDYKIVLSAMNELAKSGKIVQKGRNLKERTCFVIPDEKFRSIKGGSGGIVGKRCSP